MKIPPKPFFNFCAEHFTLLRKLLDHGAEVSEADVRRMIRTTSESPDLMPETVWRRLREFQILVAVENGSEFFVMAEPVSRLFAYLFDEARATTPEIVRGYIQSLDSTSKRLSRAIDDDDPSMIRVLVDEIQIHLRRIDADLDETHRSILSEIGTYKTARQSVSVRDRFRRIVHWMECYVDPMVEIVNTDGALQATFGEVERLMVSAQTQSMFGDVAALELTIRQLRQAGRHGLRVFQQCRRELMPLYESLRRASFIAEGASKALLALEREGLAGWSQRHLIRRHRLQTSEVPGDRGIERALLDVLQHPPIPAPVLALHEEDREPPAYLRRLWLDSLHDEAMEAAPVSDVLDWMTSRYPQRNTADTLAGLTRLIFDQSFVVQFAPGDCRPYRTPDGELFANALELAIA